MQTKSLVISYLIILPLLVATPPVNGDVFNMGIGQTDLELVPVGNAGNIGQWVNPLDVVLATLCGQVDYKFSIGKYEITAGQYTNFLNAIAKTDTYGLYCSEMWTDEFGCKIERNGEGTTNNPYIYSVAIDWANRPVNFVSWGNAARFANWLTNEQPTGEQSIDTTEDGSYFIFGAQSDGALCSINRIAEEERIPGKTYYFIPSEDEWHKAAYHKNDGQTGNYYLYPTSNDNMPGRDLTETTNPSNNANYREEGGNDWTEGMDIPYYRTVVGEFELSTGPYGTYDQGGNVFEWNEAVYIYSPTHKTRGIRGGAFNIPTDGSNDLQAMERSFHGPARRENYLGFRITMIHTPLKGDANRDGSVNLDDFILLKQNYHTMFNATWEQGDFNGDGMVNIDDFIILKQNYGV